MHIVRRQRHRHDNTVVRAANSTTRALENSTCHVNLDWDDVSKYDNSSLDIIALDELLALPGDGATSAKRLVIPYTRTPVVAYTHMWQDLYPDEQAADAVKDKVLRFNGTRVLHIHDIHDYTFTKGYYSLYDYVVSHSIDLVMFNYCGNKEFDVIAADLKRVNVPVVTIPNLPDGDVFYDRKLDKKYDIMIYGDTSSVYPLRKRLLDVIKRNNGRWKTLILEDRSISGNELAALINQSRLCVATHSFFEYLVNKYFEIGLSHAVVVGNVPKQGLSLFKDDYVRVDYTMSIGEIEDTITAALANEFRLQQQADAMTESLKMYMLRYRTHYIVKAIESAGL